MRSVRFARLLVGLYPRAWRARYEDEVLALVEQTGLGAARSLDLVLGAAREWRREVAKALDEGPRWSAVSWILLRLAAVAAAVSGLATLAAMWLSAHATPAPRIWMENGHRVVAPPVLPGLLGSLYWLLGCLAMFRAASVLRRTGASRFEAPSKVEIEMRELVLWTVGAAVSSVLAQWQLLVFMSGTGIRSSSPLETFGAATLFGFMQLEMLYLCSRAFGDSERRRRAARRLIAE
jgi:hypothetical protein